MVRGPLSRPSAIDRLARLLDDRCAQLLEVTQRLDALPRPQEVPDLTPVDLHGAARQTVARLAEVLSTDVPVAREAVREILAEPAQAVPILVNGHSRFLIQGRLRAGAVFKTESDPNGMLAALEITLPFECVV